MFGITLGKVVGASVSAVVGATIAVPIALSGVTGTGVTSADTSSQGVQSAVIDACTIGTGSAVDGGFVKSAVSSGALSLPIVTVRTTSAPIGANVGVQGNVDLGLNVNVDVNADVDVDADVNAALETVVSVANDTTASALDAVDLSAVTGLLN